MNKRTRYLLGIGVIAALVLGFQVVAFASHPEVSLPGSNFEIDTDANLKVDDTGQTPPSIDWASVTEARKPDLTSGSGDDSFGQGTKEDTPVPSVVSGSIPPNKSDLKTFGVHLETTSTGARFLNLYWNRVQDPTGTTNMDFEFNQSRTISANGVTPVRTAGDVLIQYDLANGGTHPELFLSRWITTGAGSLCEASNSTPCWSDRINLSDAGDATGSINTTAIPTSEADGLGSMSARTFGEAQIDFDALTGGSVQCVSFGSAYLKSRSSDSFTAALKDFIAPSNLNLPNCGGVTIRKETVPQLGANSPDFGFSKTFTTQPATGNTFNLKDDGVQTFSGVVQGNSYVVDENTIPAGWALTGIDCNVAGHPSTGVTPVIDVGAGTVTFDINDPGDNLDCTYTNTQQKGAILITKTAKHAASGPGDHPLQGVDFTVNGVTQTTNAAGQTCFGGLDFGTYTVHENVPAGYRLDGQNDHSVTVDNNASCSDVPFGGETTSFHNIPLTDLSVSINSQVDGGTASTVDCDNNALDGSTGANGDGTVSATNLDPSTITCTIVIDP